VVYRANTAPILSALSNQIVYAGMPLSFTASATDTDQPPQTVTFSLASGAPAGAAISSSGLFTWTPTAAQAPSTNTLSIVATDNGTPALSATQTLSVVVYRANTAPILSAISNQIVYAGMPLSFTASATDTDQPPQTVTFSLAAGAPAGAAISPSGLFTWTPTAAQAPSTNTLFIVATDNGIPALSSTRSFSVVVLPSSSLTLQSSSSPIGPFSDEPSAVINTTERTIIIPAKPTNCFYRLRSDTSKRIINLKIIGAQVTLVYQ